LITDTKLITDVPAEVQGRVLGMVSSLFGALRPVGTFVGGAVAGAIGVAVTTASGGVLLALVGVYYQVTMTTPRRGCRNLPSGRKAAR
jgi:hypothetical protein